MKNCSGPNSMSERDSVVRGRDLILVTGSGGFIGIHVVEQLLRMGFTNLRCVVRSAKSKSAIHALAERFVETGNIDVQEGNLLSRTDCVRATDGALAIIHLAAGRGEKSFPDAYMNSVVTTRNLIEAAISHGCLQRFVNVSSFAVYTNDTNIWNGILDESCPIERYPARRGDAYTFAKVKQEEIVAEYSRTWHLNPVTIRPGHVYGPGNENISARVGVGTFGIFIHLGGSNCIPLTYVENCAFAIALAAVKPGIDGEIFNVVDDSLPSSRSFLRQYKKNVRRFRSLYLPHAISYAMCWLWERYSSRSNGQLPLAFSTRRWRSFWKRTRYSNRHMKERLGWSQKVPTAEGLRRYFEACQLKDGNA